MTKILLITNTEDVTTDFIVKELSIRKLSFYRLNTDLLIDGIDANIDIGNNAFSLIEDNTVINIDEIKSVFYRRPELPKLHKSLINESEKRYASGELLFFLEGIYKLLENAYWLNNVYRIREAENKIYQLFVAKKLGFNIPQTIISNSVTEVNSFISTYDECIIKPMKSGLIESNTPQVIFTSKIDKSLINDERIKLFPNFIQRAINKVADYRITVVGEKVFCAEITSNSKKIQIDWRTTSPENLIYKPISLPADIEEKCKAITAYFNLNFAAIDIVRDDKGAYYFLEINPNGQWAWIEKRLNFGITNAVVDILQNEASV